MPKVFSEVTAAKEAKKNVTWKAKTKCAYNSQWKALRPTAQEFLNESEYRSMRFDLRGEQISFPDSQKSEFAILSNLSTNVTSP